MWRYLWLVPIYLGLASLPFLTEFGRNLEYEYTLFVSYLVLIVIPITAILTPDRLIPHRGGQYTPYIAFDIIWIFCLGPLVLHIPAFFAFAFGLCPCSKSGFSFWMALQVLPAWLLAHALYHTVFRLRVAGFKRQKLFFSGLAIYVVLILSLIISFTFVPQVRRLDLLAGFLHGPIYDNWIPVDTGVTFARIAHFFLAGLILSLAWLRKGDWASMGISIALGFSWLMTAFMAASFPSVATGKSTLNELMPSTIKNQYFTMHYMPEERAKNPSRKMRNLYHEAQFHVAELRELFGDKAPHVQIYVYPDEDAKKEWFGAGSTDVTDVFTPSVHITLSHWPHPTLRHELVHALASEFGYHGLGFHPNMAFTEGLAVALAPEERDISLHDGAAALIRSRRLPKISSLFSPFFWKESGSRAYTVAGSIISFLIETYGFESVKKLYGGDSWEEIFHEPRKNTLVKWRDFVMAKYNPDENELFAESLYRYPGVLGALCPHSKADLRRRRDRGPYIRLRQPLGWDPERDYWNWRTTIDPDDRYARISLWSSEIGKMAKERIISDGKLTVWRDSVRNARFWPPQTLEDVEMAVLEADLLRLMHGKEESVRLLTEIEEFAKTKSIGPSLTRQVRARLMIEAELPEAAAVGWRRYLAGWRENIPEISANEAWILTYLRLRGGEAKVFDTEYLTELTTIPPEQSLATTFKEEWYKFLAYRLMQLHSYDLAKQVYGAAAKKSVKANKEYFQMLKRQAGFYGTQI